MKQLLVKYFPVWWLCTCRIGFGILVHRRLLLVLCKSEYTFVLLTVYSLKASFWEFFRTNFCGHFGKLFVVTKLNFSKFREKVSLTILRSM